MWMVRKSGIKPHDPFGLVSTHPTLAEAQARAAELEVEAVLIRKWWPPTAGWSYYYVWPVDSSQAPVP